MQQLDKNGARPRMQGVLGAIAAALLGVAVFCQPNLAEAAHGGGGGFHVGGFHGGGFGVFTAADFMADLEGSTPAVFMAMPFTAAASTTDGVGALPVCITASHTRAIGIMGGTAGATAGGWSALG